MDPAAQMDPIYVKGIAGLLGGAVALTLEPPRSRIDLGRRLFVSCVCGYALPGATMRQLGLPMVDPKTGAPDVEMILAVGLLWGMAGWFVLGLILRFFTRRSDKDILDAAREIKDVATGKDKP